jgi:site-specific DNA-methyltransferase (adenine-specific)
MIITIGRKPFETTTIDNVKTHECGGINIDACRIGDELRFNQAAGTDNRIFNVSWKRESEKGRHCVGRFPSNVILSSSALDILPQASQGHWAKAKVTGYGDRIGSGEVIYEGVGEKDKEGGSVAKYFFIVRGV